MKQPWWQEMGFASYGHGLLAVSELNRVNNKHVGNEHPDTVLVTNDQSSDGMPEPVFAFNDQHTTAAQIVDALKADLRHLALRKGEQSVVVRQRNERRRAEIERQLREIERQYAPTSAQNAAADQDMIEEDGQFFLKSRSPWE